MNKVNKPNYKWFESWWMLLLLFILITPTYGLSFLLFVACLFIRLKTLSIHKKTMRNTITTDPEVKLTSRASLVNPATQNLVTKVAPRPQTTPANLDYLNYSKVRKLVPDYTVLDFETTGLNPNTNEIIQVAAVKYRNHKKVNEYSTLIKPINDIPSKITKITGITNKDVQNAPYIQVELPRLIEFIGDDVIVAHNASFDLKYLLTNIHECKLEYKKFRVIDTLSLARKNITTTENHKLATLKNYLKLSHYKSHDALHDCYVAAELYKYCYEKTLIIH